MKLRSVTVCSWTDLSFSVVALAQSFLPFADHPICSKNNIDKLLINFVVSLTSEALKTSESPIYSCKRSNFLTSAGSTHIVGADFGVQHQATAWAGDEMCVPPAGKYEFRSHFRADVVSVNILCNESKSGIIHIKLCYLANSGWSCRREPLSVFDLAMRGASYLGSPHCSVTRS